MELQYIVLTIIKILISVPAIVVLLDNEVDAAALIGGHVKNNASKIDTTDSYDFKIDLTDENSQEYPDNSTEAGNSEEVPDPSPLIVPGYNLPENIFNRGKPFYLEKDPLTGSVDFDSKATQLHVYDDYEYEDEESPAYDKSQIDRKDGPISGGHKPSDINQLTPNFHDFLNLPVKYNPDKYVYPLISSSYANTKVQGNVNKQHNHKNYEITTYKPTLSPTYFTTKNVYSQNKVIEYGQKNKDKYEGTTKSYQGGKNEHANLMHSPMNHPSFQEGSSYPGYQDQYANKGTNQPGYQDQYANKGSNQPGYQDQYGNKGSNQPGYQDQYANKGSKSPGYQDEYANKGQNPPNYTNKGSNYQDEYTNKGSNYQNEYSNKGSNYQDEYANKATSRPSFQEGTNSIQTTTKKPEYLASKYTTLKPTFSTASMLDNRGPNLMHSPMNHPSFTDEATTSKPVTTTTAKSTTTKRVMSLFEQLFGSDYDDTTTEMDATTTKPVPPKLFDNLPSNKKTPTTTTRNALAGNMGYSEEEEEEERPTTKKEQDEYEYYDYQDKYTGSKEKYQTTTVSHEKNSQKYPANNAGEKNPMGSTNVGEKYPAINPSNAGETYPVGSTNAGDTYAVGSGNNAGEKYSTGSANAGEKYPVGSANGGEKYPVGTANAGEKNPVNNPSYAGDKYLPASASNAGEKYPMGSANNPSNAGETYLMGSANSAGEKYLLGEKYPMGSMNDGEKYSMGTVGNEKYPYGSGISTPAGFTHSENTPKYPVVNKYDKFNNPPSSEDSFSTLYANGYAPVLSGNKFEDYATTRRDAQETYASSTTSTTAELPQSTYGGKKVTSLPLGENHVTHFHAMIASNNLREKLNAEKVAEQKYNSVVHPQAPSASNIHIAPDQDTVSFVVGNHQNVDGNESGAGGYVGTSLKESPYDNNPFRPVYSVQPGHEDAFRWTEAQKSSTSALPVRTTEPILIVQEESAEYPSGVGNKIVFPTERTTTYTPDLSPPPPPKQPQGVLNREVLKLSSKPMFHQLPSDLTPPNENDALVPPRLDRERVRPPWDPRPGHFHAGRPEYARPPRPAPELYKRIDNLPNILPQFRPNVKPHHHHGHHHHHHGHHQYQGKNYARQPLLERPSNRPIGFFEKLHPPPMSKNDQKIIEDRIGMGTNKNHLQEPFAFLQAPPKIVVSNRRSGDDIETLQMIQAKKEKVEPVKSTLTTSLSGKDTLEKPLYVVYPVNTPPLKLDVLDTNKKESVVIGTRAELPLPPNKIAQEKPDAVPSDFKKPNNDFILSTDFKKPVNEFVLSPDFKKPVNEFVMSTDFKKPLNDFKIPTDFKKPGNDFITSPEFNYEMSERHDAPLLKPRPGPFPVKTDFPYPLERPDPSILHRDSTVEEIGNNLPDEPVLVSSNQWNTIDDAQARIVNHNIGGGNQISVTLKTHTEKPIAVAYTPTTEAVGAYTKEYAEIVQGGKYQEYHDRFSMPNYGGVVIPEIRPNSEITVGAVMHARPQPPPVVVKVDRVDDEGAVPAQDFQAPFQASAHVDHAVSQGWSVVKNNNEERKDEATTPAVATTSEFDIENFKPQLEGGFKPIYSFPEDQKDDSLIGERQE